jgi:hypothetical protein
LDHAASISGVIAASSALRAQLRPCHSHTFLTTCWLTVEAPRTEPSAMASRMAAMSNPQCRQKLASSAATADRAITGAIRAIGTGSREIAPSRRSSCQV